MKKRISYLLGMALIAGFVGCGETPEVTPELPEKEEEEVIVEDPIVSSYSPNYMIEGETAEIQIEGKHFSEDAADVVVTLLNAAGEEITLEIETSGSTLISASAATISTIGEYSLVVKVKEKKVTAAEKFVVHGKLAVDPIVGSSLEDGSYTIEVGGYLLLTGKNFSAVEENNQVFLVNAAGEETETVLIVSKSDRVGFLVPETLPLGNYKMKIVTDIQALLLENTLIVEEASPRIESVSPVSLYAGEDLTISGKFFSAVAEENVVSLSNGYQEFTLSISSASETEIVATAGSELEAGEYTLSLSKNGKKTYYNQQKITILSSPTNPVITSINKTGFAKGETIVITGENLKKEFTATNINFMPFYGGTTIVRSAVANDAGTEVTYTIPDDFPSGSYVIVVEVDFEYSEEYGDVIKIN